MNLAARLRLATRDDGVAEVGASAGAHSINLAARLRLATRDDGVAEVGAGAGARSINLAARLRLATRDDGVAEVGAFGSLRGTMGSQVPCGRARSTSPLAFGSLRGTMGSRRWVPVRARIRSTSPHAFGSTTRDDVARSAVPWGARDNLAARRRPLRRTMGSRRWVPGRSGREDQSFGAREPCAEVTTTADSGDSRPFAVDLARDDPPSTGSKP